MSTDKDVQGSTEGGQENHQAEELIENLTPEEKKKWSEKFLRLEYYKAISKTILQILKDFSKWAALAVSGVGALIGGWYSLRKMAKQQRSEMQKWEIKKEVSQTTIKTGKPSLYSARRTHDAPVVSLSRDTKTGSTGKNAKSVRPTEQPTPITAIETSASIFDFQMAQSLMMDPLVVTTIISLLVFLSMSIKMSFNRFFAKRRKGEERRGPPL